MFNSSHSIVKKFTIYFSLFPAITDAPRGRIILGAQHFGGIVQKGIDNLSDCLKKCANLGPGISDIPTDLAGPTVFGDEQICFGVNYDFATHKCYFLTNNFPRLLEAQQPVFSLCPVVGGEIVRVPVDLQPNPSVITVLLCKLV